MIGFKPNFVLEPAPRSTEAERLSREREDASTVNFRVHRFEPLNPEIDSCSLHFCIVVNNTVTQIVAMRLQVFLTTRPHTIFEP